MRQNNKSSLRQFQAEEWIKKAHDDELNTRSILKHRDGAPSGACFLSHQFAEKYFKAFIVSRKKWFPRIHPLDTLVELCMEIDTSFADIKDYAIFLNSFYLPARYPGEYPDFSWKDAKEALEAAIKIKEFIVKKLAS